MDKNYDLERFLKAQELMYPWALKEVKSGRKQTHWMWFIFPQHKALGVSSKALYYGIESIGEAREYIAHPVLGARLREISLCLLELAENDPEKIFGEIDALKLCSSMTLFAHATEDNEVFISVIKKLYGGQEDVITLSLIGIK